MNEIGLILIDYFPKSSNFIFETGLITSTNRVSVVSAALLVVGGRWLQDSHFHLLVSHKLEIEGQMVKFWDSDLCLVVTDFLFTVSFDYPSSKFEKW